MQRFFKKLCSDGTFEFKMSRFSMPSILAAIIKVDCGKAKHLMNDNKYTDDQSTRFLVWYSIG